MPPERKYAAILRKSPMWEERVRFGGRPPAVRVRPRRVDELSWRLGERERERRREEMFSSGVRILLLDWGVLEVVVLSDEGRKAAGGMFCDADGLSRI